MAERKTPLLSILFLVTSLNASSIDVAGSISSSISWVSDTVRVVGDVTVENGVTLTVNPGTHVEFQGYFKLDIQGRIIATGTESDSISFTNRDTLVGWHGIRFNKTSPLNDTSSFTFCNFSNGLATGSDYEAYGGAFFLNSFSRLVISRSVFVNNRVRGYKSYGGAICCVNASPVISDITFIANRGSWGGAALYCRSNSSLRLTNIFIEKSRSDDGGGIYCDSSSLIIKNLIAEYGYAVNGGALYCNASTLSITDAKFLSNEGGGATGYGGAIYLKTSSAALTNTIFTENNASFGGAVFSTNSSTIFRNVLFDKNEALNRGGALCCWWSSPVIVNTTFSRNSCPAGSALYCSLASSPDVKNSIFWFNAANDTGGIVYLEDTASEPQFTNSSIQGGRNGISGPGATSNFKGISSNCINANPLFTDTSKGDFTLLTGSPSINAGTSDTAGLGLPEQDLAGNNRISGLRIDMGPYEYGASAPVRFFPGSKHSRTIFMNGFPNPFIHNITIAFTLPVNAAYRNARMEIYTIHGKKIKTMFDGSALAGVNFVKWDGTDLSGYQVSASIYLCKILVNETEIEMLRIIKK